MLLCFAAAFLASCESLPKQRVTTVDECNLGPWSSQSVLSEDMITSGTVARFPSVAATRSGPVYVAGNDIAGFTADTVPDNPLTVWQLGGRSLGRPPGTFRFAYPKALIDDEDHLHLIWAEPLADSPPITARDWHRRPRPRSVWTSRYRPGAGWSVPRKVLEDANLWWDESVTTGQVTSGSSQWTLAVSTLKRGATPASIRLIGLARDSVMTSTIANAGGLYTRLASAGTDVLIGYLAPAPRAGPGSDGNSVFVAASSDGGATWRPPILVSRSGAQPAYELQTVTGSDGVVHLIWLQTIAGAPDVIRHVMSRDGGRTWSARDDLHPEGKTAGLDAVIDACGTVHLVFEHWDASWRAHLEYVTWRERWSHVEPLFPELIVSGRPTLHRAPDGRLSLAFMGMQADAVTGTPITTMYAQRSVK